MFCISRIYTIRSSMRLQKKTKTLPPLYPHSNWLAENTIKTIKTILRKCKDWTLGLLIHRSTPDEHGVSPAEMLMERKLRTNLLVLTKKRKISISFCGTNKQRVKQKPYFNRLGTRKLELLKPEDPVQVHDPLKKSWCEARTVAEVAPCSYTVLASSNIILWWIAVVWYAVVSYQKKPWVPTLREKEEEQIPL